MHALMSTKPRKSHVIPATPSASNQVEKVTCKIKVDDKVKEVKYNDEDLDLDPSFALLCCKLRETEFIVHESPYPGQLYIKGEDYQKGEHKNTQESNVAISLNESAVKVVRLRPEEEADPIPAGLG